MRSVETAFFRVRAPGESENPTSYVDGIYRSASDIQVNDTDLGLVFLEIELDDSVPVDVSFGGVTQSQPRHDGADRDGPPTSVGQRMSERAKILRSK